jgi:hypothetical protein
MSRAGPVGARISGTDGQTWTSSACWHKRKLGVDLWQVPRQNSVCNTYALEHDPAQRQVGFLLHVDMQHHIPEKFFQEDLHFTVAVHI